MDDVPQVYTLHVQDVVFKLVCFFVLCGVCTNALAYVLCAKCTKKRDTNLRVVHFCVYFTDVGFYKFNMYT